MIEIKEIEKLVDEKIAGTDLFLVEVKVSLGNAISISIDAPNGIGIKQCIEVSKHVEEQFDREEEDFSLEVSSPGIGLPFRVNQQYQKALNRTVEVLFSDGIKQQGKLIQVNETNFTIEFTVKEKPEGAKRPKELTKNKEISFDEVKSTTEIITV